MQGKWWSSGTGKTGKMKVKKENSGCARERGRIKGHGTQPKL